MSYFPSESMSADGFLPIPANSISLFGGSSPVPALIRIAAIDFTPKDRDSSLSGGGDPVFAFR